MAAPSVDRLWCRARSLDASSEGVAGGQLGDEVPEEGQDLVDVATGRGGVDGPTDRVFHRGHLAGEAPPFRGEPELHLASVVLARVALDRAHGDEPVDEAARVGAGLAHQQLAEPGQRERSVVGEDT